MLKKYDLRRSIITIESKYTQREICEIVANKKGHYVLRVDENDNSLIKEVKDILSEDSRRRSIMYNGGNYNYHIVMLKKGEVYGSSFPGIKSYIELRPQSEAITRETQYFISSFDVPQMIVYAIEHRWLLEDDQSWECEYNKKSQPTFRDKNAIRILKVINNVVVALCKAVCSIETGKSKKQTMNECDNKQLDHIAFILEQHKKKGLKEQIKEKLK